MRKLAVAALGGNALIRGSQLGTITEQEENARQTCEGLIALLKKGYDLIITHGNGPQVGNILLRNEAGYSIYKIPKMPLDICVADSQGGIGYMLEKEMKNLLWKNKIKKNVITIVTQVEVDPEDPAFKEPTKPVGGFFLKEEADLLARANNWVFREDPRKRGWRRVVASPNPVDIINRKVIKELAREGNIVIASGGGGIPVMKGKDGMYRGIDAVIDKDLAGALLAIETGANEFYILTDVPKVYINFHKPDQKALDRMSVRQAQKFLKAGEFASGSMGPKVQAAVNFTKHTGRDSIITESDKLNDLNSGTRITI